MTTPREDLTLHLPDGRRLGYALYGAADGYPVVSCHGGLSCRIDVRSADEAATAAGLRLIAPDRPGIATSDRLPGRSILAFADDVTGLADALKLDRFSVLGWSLGGQYALALAHALAPRVERAAVVAGAVPLDRPGGLDELNEMDRRLIRLAQDHPARQHAYLRSTGLLARYSPAAFARSSGRGLPQATVTRVAGAGHFVARSRWGAIMGWLAGSAT